MTKKDLMAHFKEQGLSFSYSGHTKTLYIHDYTPGMEIELPENTNNISIVGLEKHKLL